MNKKAFLITATLVSGLFWVGCNKSGKLNQASTFTAPTGPMELKLKWPAGEQVLQSIEMKMNMEITVPNQPNPVKQDMTMREEYGLRVLKADADGGHELEMEFLNMRMKVDQGGKTVIDYDSGKKASADRNNPTTATLEKTFQNIIGAKIQYFLDASNQVERIEGVDALMSQLTTGSQADAVTGIKSMFSEDSLKQMISGQHLPPKPVQPGDTWPEKMDIAMGDLGIMAMDYTFTFERWETHGKRTCARLEFQGGMKSKSNPNPTPTGTTVSVQDGNSSGVSWFDPELGMVIETIMNQDMNMNINVPVNMGAKTTTQKLTALMKQAITVKMESVK